MKMESMYEQLGVSAAVYEYGERIIAELRDRFDAIDQTAEYNQAKVLSAMQKMALINQAFCFCFRHANTPLEKL